MANRHLRSDSYRPGAPTNRVHNSLRHSDRYTPNRDLVPCNDTPHIGPTAPREPLPYNDEPNARTIGPRAQHHSPHGVQHVVDSEHDNYRGLLCPYDQKINCLIGRTQRACLLVANYQADCPAGHRWTPEVSHLIFEMGRNLDRDRAALDSLRATLGQGGDAVSKRTICSDAEKLRKFCLEIQDLINRHEQKSTKHGQAVDVDQHSRSVELRIRGAADVMEGDQQESGHERGQPQDQPRYASGTDYRPARSTGGAYWNGDGDGRGYGIADCWRRDRDGPPR